VARTAGAEFHPALDQTRIQTVVSKAVTRDAEAYSGFHGTDLAPQLSARGVNRVFVCGLATDYCVKATALDARSAGLGVVVIEDAIRGVEVKPGDCVKAIDEMRASAIVLAPSGELTALR
jgi:nicotinamidase-related amidase